MDNEFINLNSEYVFRCKGITKLYNNQKALDNFSMNVRNGEIYGFVGENGSGKTTIIRVLTGLIKYNSGEYELFGVKSNDPNIVNARKRIGAIVETPSIYSTLNLKDNMKILGMLVDNRNEDDIRKVLTLVGLYNIYNDKKKVGNYSLGMRQRLGIAMALLKKPKFLILDEPMNGLDPQGVVSMRNLILDLNRNEGITFLISSHILNELSLIATSYGIISKGRMIKEVSKDELNNSVKHEAFIKVNDENMAYDILKDICECEKLSGEIRITGDFEINVILKKLALADIDVFKVDESHADIEKYYLNLIAEANHGNVN